MCCRLDSVTAITRKKHVFISQDACFFIPGFFFYALVISLLCVSVTITKPNLNFMHSVLPIWKRYILDSTQSSEEMNRNDSPRFIESRQALIFSVSAAVLIKLIVVLGVCATEREK